MSQQGPIVGDLIGSHPLQRRGVRVKRDGRQVPGVSDSVYRLARDGHRVARAERSRHRPSQCQALSATILASTVMAAALSS